MLFVEFHCVLKQVRPCLLKLFSSYPLHYQFGHQVPPNVIFIRLLLLLIFIIIIILILSTNLEVFGLKLKTWVKLTISLLVCNKFYSFFLLERYLLYIQILHPFQFVCSLFYFGISQNIVLFLKIKVINLPMFLLYPYFIFKTIWKEN